MKTLRSIITFIIAFGSWVFIGAFVLVVIFTIGSNTNAFGGYRSFMVLSGSMEPSIMIGDVIVVHKQPSYMKNDVITFYSEEQRIVTHRVEKRNEEQNPVYYTTKGDANRSEDEGEVYEDAVIGKVILVVPKIGYFVSFVKTLPGLIILIGIPSLILIIDQLFKLKDA